MESRDLLVGLSLVIVLGVTAQWVAWRVRVPAILLLLAAGAVAGPGSQAWTGHKWFDPDQTLGAVLGPVVSLSVAIILFEGGLTLKLSELTHVGRVVRNLVTVGAAVTFTVTAVSAHLLLRLPWQLSVLLGAILVVTGPTVIGPLLRHVRPVGRVTPILKWEGIVIDPLGAVLAVLVFDAIRVGYAASAVDPNAGHLTHAVHAVGHVVGQAVHTVAPAVAVTVAKTALAGLTVGLAAAGLLVVMLWRYWMADHLANPFTLGLVVAAYTGAELWQTDSGLLAVTVMGIALANQRLAPFKHIHEFKESLSVLLVSGLFILLSSKLDVEQFRQMSWRTAAFVAALIVVGRPAAVWASSVGSELSWREKLFLSGIAPRGIVAAAVSSLFALRLKEAGVAGADQLVPVTFAVIVCTVVVYGLSAIPLARGLGLAKAGPAGFLVIGANPLARSVATAVGAAGQRVVLVDTNPGQRRRREAGRARRAARERRLRAGDGEAGGDRHRRHARADAERGGEHARRRLLRPRLRPEQRLPVGHRQPPVFRPRPDLGRPPRAGAVRRRYDVRHARGPVRGRHRDGDQADRHVHDR